MTYVSDRRAVTRFAAQPSAVSGTAIGLAVVVAANIACVAGLAGFVTAGFVSGSIVTAIVLARTRPLASCEFVLWLWLLGPQVRRVVDLSTTYHEPSLILTAAPVATLATLPHLRRLRCEGLARAVRPLLVVTVALGAAYALGAMRTGVRPASIALLTWLVPVLFGMQLLAVADDAGQLRTMVERVLVWGTLVVGVYGVVQFYTAPPWDAYWMANVPMNSIGSPEPFHVRVFSTLNSPGPLGVFLAASIVYLSDARHRLRIPAQAAGCLALGLSLVRSAWLACLLGFVVVLLTGSSRARTNVVAIVGVTAVGVLLISGPVQTVVSDRIDETRSGRQDDSFVARAALHQQVLPTLLVEPAGRGLGAYGTATLQTDGQGDGLVNLDSGLLEYGLTLGMPVTLIVLGSLVAGVMHVARRGVRPGIVSAGTVAGALTVLAQMAFGNSLSGVGGVTFFALWALAVRQIGCGSAAAATRTAP